MYIMHISYIFFNILYITSVSCGADLRKQDICLIISSCMQKCVWVELWVSASACSCVCVMAAWGFWLERLGHRVKLTFLCPWHFSTDSLWLPGLTQCALRFIVFCSVDYIALFTDFLHPPLSTLWCGGVRCVDMCRVEWAQGFTGRRTRAEGTGRFMLCSIFTSADRWNHKPWIDHL